MRIGPGEPNQMQILLIDPASDICRDTNLVFGPKTVLFNECLHAALAPGGSLPDRRPLATAHHKQRVRLKPTRGLDQS